MRARRVRSSVKNSADFRRSAPHSPKSLCAAGEEENWGASRDPVSCAKMMPTERNQRQHNVASSSPLEASAEHSNASGGAGIVRVTCHLCVIPFHSRRFGLQRGDRNDD